MQGTGGGKFPCRHSRSARPPGSREPNRETDIKNPASKACGVSYVSLVNYSSGTMAPLGQVSLQEPQSRQAAASMT